MKINETKHDHIDEGPLDLLTKSGREQRRAFKGGRATLKKTTDNLKKEFASYLGRQGKKNFKQATTQDVIAFLNDKNVDTSNIGPAGMTPQRMHDIFVAKSQEAIMGKGAKPEPKQEPVSSAYAQTKDSALKLNAKEKRRLIQQLEKSIKTRPAKKTGVVDKNFDRNQKLSDYGKVGK
jgi:hypothetical protein